MNIKDIADFIQQQIEADLAEDLVNDLKNDLAEVMITIEETEKYVGQDSPEAESICRAVLNSMKTKVACHTLVVGSEEDLEPNAGSGIFMRMTGEEENPIGGEVKE